MAQAQRGPSGVDKQRSSHMRLFSVHSLLSVIEYGVFYIFLKTLFFLMEIKISKESLSISNIEKHKLSHI